MLAILFLFYQPTEYHKHNVARHNGSQISKNDDFLVLPVGRVSAKGDPSLGRSVPPPSKVPLSFLSGCISSRERGGKGLGLMVPQPPLDKEGGRDYTYTSARLYCTVAATKVGAEKKVPLKLYSELL